nr:gustatory receptor 13 [Achelura yunnanensis]
MFKRDIKKVGSRSSNYTYRHLDRLLKIFALSYNVQRNNHFQTLTSILRIVSTATIIGFCNFFALYIKIVYRYKELNVSIRLMDFLQSIYNYCQYLTDIYFVYKYGREISLEYFKQYKNLDVILGTMYQGEIKERLLKLTILFSIIWTTSSACDYAAWALNHVWTTPIAFSTSFIFLLIKILTTLDFTTHVMHVECRLRIIGDFVQNYFDVSENLSGVLGEFNDRKCWFRDHSGNLPAELGVMSRQLKTYSSSDCHEVDWLIQCYLFLTEQCTFINTMYGTRILLISTSLLIDMITYANTSARIIIGAMGTEGDFIFGVEEFTGISTLMRLLTCAVVMISVVDHCERVYRQRERILTVIDHLLISKLISAETRKTMNELRELVKSRAISFHMANLVSLQYSLLVSIASVVVSYTIILLQSIK